MTNIDRPRPRRTPRRAAPGNPRRPSVERISHGVVAAYIHDISGRHARPRCLSDRTVLALERYEERA